MIYMNVLVFGGDTRQIYCAGGLRLCPFMNVTARALKEDDEKPTGKTDVLILPYVSCRLGCINAPLAGREISFDEVYETVKNGTVVFAGMLPENIKNDFIERGAILNDWFDNEELTLKNAELTAEGAAQVIIKKSDKAVGGSKILVLGWGRVAKASAKLFRSMGADITIAARREEARRDAVDHGFKAVDFSGDTAIEEADIIVNTVPERVLPKDKLKIIKPGGWILELASAPYGLDFEEAKELGIEAVLGSGLPGKYTPEAAGRYMAEAVIGYFGKDGESCG